MKAIGAVLLSIIIVIAIPTSDEGIYKAMHDRHHITQDVIDNKDTKPLRGRKK